VSVGVEVEVNVGTGVGVSEGIGVAVRVAVLVGDGDGGVGVNVCSTNGVGLAGSEADNSAAQPVNTNDIETIKITNFCSCIIDSNPVSQLKQN